MFRFLILLSILFAACNWEEPAPEYDYDLDYDNAKEAAISAWEMKVDWVSEECLEHLNTVRVIETWDILEDCGEGARGCMFTTPEGVPYELSYVDAHYPDLTRLEIAMHEYIHHIETCEFPPEYWQDDSTIQYSGRSGGHFNKAVWGNQDDSVENQGKRIVRELSRM